MKIMLLSTKQNLSFDYQKFQKNPRLEAMLAEAEGRCAEIDEDALEMVSAAGDDQRMLNTDSIAYDKTTTVPVGNLFPEDCL